GVSPYATSTNSGTLLWSYDTGDIVRCSPIVGGDGTVYIANGATNSTFYALLENGSLKWSRSLTGQLLSSAVLGQRGTMVYAATTVMFGADRVYALQQKTGSLSWSYTSLVGNTTSNAVNVQGGVAVGADGTVYADLYSSGNVVAFTAGGSV